MTIEVRWSDLLDAFPWADSLPTSDRAEFVLDVVRALEASSELGQWSLLAQTVREWASTAAIHADPDLARILREPTADPYAET